ncbi:MAG: universal stress protein [Planctomycetales bacterium]|nr:universal stress protein [Planctomycetales bacterium]
MKWFNNKRILVPFDFSDACLDAIGVAKALAVDTSDIHVIHVLENLPATSPLSIWDPEADEHRKETARKAIKDKLADLDISNVHLDVSIGNPARVVADLAKDIECGLIIIPSNSRSTIERFLIGSVAERVVRLAPCPVLVLKNGV